MLSGLELCILLPWVPSSSSLSSPCLWSSNAHLPTPPHHLGSGHAGSGGTLRRTGGSTSAACGLNRPLCVPWQVPWLKQGRSPLPPHARRQPGLCNMYKVRRASHQLLRTPHFGPCPHRGLSMQVLWVLSRARSCPGVQQVSPRVCKAPGESQQRTVCEDREEGGCRPDPWGPAWIRALSEGQGRAGDKPWNELTEGTSMGPGQTQC